MKSRISGSNLGLDHLTAGYPVTHSQRAKLLTYGSTDTNGASEGDSKSRYGNRIYDVDRNEKVLGSIREIES